MYNCMLRVTSSFRKNFQQHTPDQVGLRYDPKHSRATPVKKFLSPSRFYNKVRVKAWNVEVFFCKM